MDVRGRARFVVFGLAGFASSLVITRVRTEAGVDRGRAIEAPAFSEAAICFGPEVRATIFIEGNTACRSRMRETPNASTSTTITRTSVRRLAAASNVGSMPEAVMSLGFRVGNFPLMRASGRAGEQDLDRRDQHVARTHEPDRDLA